MSSLACSLALEEEEGGVCSLDERLGLREVAMRFSVVSVCGIGELSKSSGTTSG